MARQIEDDDFLHALRVYRDPDSKAVRLQASVLTGEMKKFVLIQPKTAMHTDLVSSTPVWTAFITNYLTSPLWFKRVSSKVVCLSELRRHVFSSDYTPHQTRYGDHALEFTTAKGKLLPVYERLEKEMLIAQQTPRILFARLTT